MPQKSLKSAVQEDLEGMLVDRELQQVLHLIGNEEEEDEDEDTIADLIDMAVRCGYESLQNRRYLSRQSSRKGNKLFERDLDCDETGKQLPWLTQEEFLQKYRMSRKAFHQLVGMIRDHPVFNSNTDRVGGKKQAPVEYQFMVLLNYLRTSGSGAASPRQRNIFGISRGTCNLYRKRCVKAIQSLKEAAIQWPNEEERKEIANRILAKYQWPNCIAVADGTLLPLTYAPQSEDAPDYSGRKFQYSLSCMIVNDDKRKVRYYLSGFPGSVYNSTKLATDPETYFGNKYFLLGDSAIPNSPSVVSSFKAPKGHELPRDHEQFNYHLPKVSRIEESENGTLQTP